MGNLLRKSSKWDSDDEEELNGYNRYRNEDYSDSVSSTISIEIPNTSSSSDITENESNLQSIVDTCFNDGICNPSCKAGMCEKKIGKKKGSFYVSHEVALSFCFLLLCILLTIAAGALIYGYLVSKVVHPKEGKKVDDLSVSEFTKEHVNKIMFGYVICRINGKDEIVYCDSDVSDPKNEKNQKIARVTMRELCRVQKNGKVVDGPHISALEEVEFDKLEQFECMNGEDRDYNGRKYSSR